MTIIKNHFEVFIVTSKSREISCVPIKTHSQYAMTIEIDRLVMSILGSLEVVHLLLTNFHHIVNCDR
jgi:hypothetical protein